MPENIRKQLKDFKEDGKPLKYLINYIPDDYFDGQRIIAELTELGYDVEEIVKCLEHDFGLDMTQCVDKLEQAMQSADFWVELADTSFGKVVLHGKNADRDTGEYYEVSSEINTDGDFAITFFKTYNKMKKWFNDWQGEGFYEYLVELYEKQLTQ